MKRKAYMYIVGLAVMLGMPRVIPAQSLEDVWHQVENNNLTIKALKQQAEAERMEHRVGLAPEDPEVEFAYLWGSPQAIGHRIDFSVTQNFDFPTTYVYKSRIANLKGEQSAMEVQKHCREMMIEVGKLYYEIVYQNARIADMTRCLGYVSQVAEAYKAQLEAGSINIFDYNKVKITALNMKQELGHAVVVRDNLLRELKQYNGGTEMPIADTLFPAIALPADFDTWYSHAEQKNPMLLWLDKELEISEQQQKLSKSEWVPHLMAGYMREQVPSEIFQGVKVGLSIPLWSNLNALKQSKLQSSAVNLLIADERFRFRNSLQSQFMVVQSHLRQIAEYEALLEGVGAFDLLQLALEKREISIIDYLTEYTIYHESHERLLELKKDAAQNFVELKLCE